MTLRDKAKDELWRRGVLTWKLHTTQKIVYASLRALPRETREAVVLISRRWGKSYLGVAMALEDCARYPGSQVFIVGPSLKQTRRIITPIIREMCLDAPSGFVRQSKSDLTWHVGESTLIIGAFDTALESFRGLEAEAIYLEESGLANPQDYDYTLKSVLRPTLMHSRGRITHLTTPPREEDHPFVSATMPAAVINNALYTYTIEDNPLLTPEEIETEIAAAGGRGSEHCERELFCRIVRDTKRLICPEFQEAESVKEFTPPDYTYYLTSIDFGGTQDNHALLLCYYDFELNKVRVLDEGWLDINTPTDEVLNLGTALEQRHNVRWLTGEPYRIIDAPGQIHVDIRRMGYNCRAPSKGKDSVEEGIQACRVAFRKGQLEIHPRCVRLINTLKYGMWDKTRTTFQRTEALGHCDMIAALSYAYRHVDRQNNPFPPGLGLVRHIHDFPRIEATGDEAALALTYYGD